MMAPDKLTYAKAVVDELAREAQSPNGWRLNGLLADAHEALTWAVDEIEQLREDRREAVQVAVRLGHQIADLEEMVSELETNEILADQRLDYLLASR